jgi:flagellar hook-length control protein FliK
LATFVASAAQPGAAQHLTIRLDPAELGRVQVHIERAPGGAARVELVVERPDTLLLLLRDQPQLHRALDLAGVPIADRTLQFHLAPSVTANLGTATPQSNADAGPGQQRPGQPQHRGSNNGSAGSPDNSTLRSILRPATAFRRAGVDIMA